MSTEVEVDDWATGQVFFNVDVPKLKFDPGLSDRFIGTPKINFITVQTQNF
jgi:hypothetical protein